MRTAGSVLKEARERQGKTVPHVARQTRIKEKFLAALEESDWACLPNFAVAHGFARSYASAVGANLNLVLALLRRDFPKHQPVRGAVNLPVQRASLWTPRATIFAAVLVILVAAGGYLIKEYIQFSAPPALALEPIKLSGRTVVVSGRTTPNATVDINGQPVLVDGSGGFKMELDRKDLTNSLVEVEAVSRTGKKSTLKQSVD